MEMKRIKYIALVLILIFGLIGVAYATWTDTITIDGVVETGSIDVQWGDIADEESWHYSMYADPGPDRPGVMYADLVANYKYSEVVGVSPDGKVLTLELYNTIPELLVRKLVDVTNSGTAPVALDKIWFTPDSGIRDEAADHPVDGFIVDGTNEQLRFSVHDVDAGWVYITKGMELAAGETKQFAISVHTLPTADMNQTLNYKLELEWKLKDPSVP